MYLFHFHLPQIQYLLKRNLTHFFLSILIRNLAIGMIVIFEPIYLYFFFNHSLSLTLLFFGASHGLYGLLAVWSGKALAKFGPKNCLFAGNLLLFCYLLFLYLLSDYPFFVTIALLAKSLAMAFFWPAFHLDFLRFSEKKHIGVEVGEMSAIRILPVIIAPGIGGWVIANFGYPVLFIVALIIIFISLFPLAFCKEKHEIYLDSYEKAIKRILEPQTRTLSLALAANSIELGINRYLWPIFLFILAINFFEIGQITSFSLGIAALFSIYIGKLTETQERFKLLIIGSLLTAIAWIFKYLVKNPLDALFALSFYRFSRVSAGIPFTTLFYEKAAKEKEGTDEFIISRTIITELSRFFFFLILAGFFAFLPPIKVNLTFLIASFASLFFILIATPYFKINLLNKFFSQQK